MRLCVCLTLIVLVGLWGRISAQSMSSVVKDLHWNPVDSNEIAIAYQDGRIELHNLTTQTSEQIGASQTTQPLQFVKIAWHPQGQFLAAGIGSTVYIWQKVGTSFQLYDQILAGNADAIAHLESGDAPESIYSMDWSHDGSKLAISATGGLLTVWQLINHQILAGGPSNLEARPLDWASTKDVLLRGDAYIDYAKQSSSYPLQNISPNAQYSYISAVDWKNDDRHYVIGDVGGYIVIVDSLAPESTISYRPFLPSESLPLPIITDIQWLDAQNKIIETDRQGHLVVLDAASGQVVYSINHNGPLYALDIDSSGTKIAYGGESLSGQDTGFSIISVSSVLPDPALASTPSNTSETASQSSDAQALKDMLFPATCIQACFFGMQPEVTTRQQFETFLNQNQITPYIVSPNDLDNTHYQWDLPSQTVFKPQSGSIGQVIFKQGKIVRITLPLDIPLSEVYEVFGSPDTVTNYDDRVITLIYKELGAAITLSRQSNHTRTLDVILASATSKYESFLAQPPGELVNHTCNSYGAFPCIAPTATPGPINDNRSTAQPSDAVILQNLLTSPGCIGACYWGLEPMVTSRQQAETILAQHGIKDYDVVLPYPYTDNLIESSSYYWDQESFLLREPSRRFEIMFGEGYIHQILLPIRVSAQVVTEAFGSPDQVIMPEESTGTIYSFVYLSRGMIFSFSVIDNMTKNVVLANASSSHHNAVNWVPGDPVERPCATYGTLPCIVPTSTSPSK
jgi:hypothetical protein